jgi:hypothetical protein
LIVCPFNVKLVEAFPTTRPGVAELKVRLHWPFASVVVGTGPDGTGVAPFDGVNVIEYGNPAGAGAKLPPPAFKNTLAVNVCD